MNIRLSRRGAMLGAAALVCARGGIARNSTRPGTASGAAAHLADLEKREGGRLGVAALDTGTGRDLQYGENERFAMCSTFKFLAAAAILQRVDQGKESLGRWVAFGESDLLEYAPVSKEHVRQQGMTLGDICAAAVQWSDNTAANLILKALGGPAGVTRFVRSLGDSVTRLDDVEPALNVVKAGDVRNTSSPASMLSLLSTVLFGQVLGVDSRARLEGWMLDAKVGEKRIPAGLPAGWRIAHKTGTGSDETNDVGIVWPPDRAPIVVAAFYSQGAMPQERRETVLREVGRVVAEGI
jgi:beta-lactamase class A